QRIGAGKLTAEHYLLVPKRLASSGEVWVDVSAVLGSMEYNSHAPRVRRMPLAELTAALQSTGTSAQLGASLGYHRAYIRKLRGRLARGVLTEQSPRPIRLRLHAGRVKFSAEKGSGMPQRLRLDADLAWLLGFYCAEGSIGQHGGRPNSCTLVFSCGHHEQ